MPTNDNNLEKFEKIIGTLLETVKGQYKNEEDLNKLKKVFIDNQEGTVKLIALLQKAKKTKTIGELCEFIPIEERIDFFEKVFEKYEKNKDIFKLITNNATMMQAFYGKKIDFIPLFVYGLASNGSTIDLTIKQLSKKLSGKKAMRKADIFEIYDTSSFFIPKTKYDRFIKNSTYYGRMDDAKGKTTQWVMPTISANSLIKKIASQETKEKMKKTYADELGLDESAIKDEKAFYCINLNGKAIRKIAEASMQLPGSDSLGANDFWIPGGFTSGGIPEMIVNGIPRSEPYKISEDEHDFSELSKISSKKLANEHNVQAGKQFPESIKK